MANNSRTSLQLHTEEKKDEGPAIAPIKLRPMEGSQRKNPFKKRLAANNDGHESFSHLTGNAIGFSSPKSSEVEPLQESNQNTTKKPAQKFYEENRERLEKENPEASENEILLIAAKAFRLSKMSAKKSTPEQSSKSEKRKLDETEKPGSGLSKLARFEYGKN